MASLTAKPNADGSVDLTGKQGSTWSMTITLTDQVGAAFDLTGYSAAGMVRKTPSASAKTKDFVVTLSATPTDGTITVSMSASDTAAITAGDSVDDDDSLYYYDVEITSGTGIVTRIIQGKLYIDPECTKA